jgi:hypothetical protein
MITGASRIPEASADFQSAVQRAQYAAKAIGRTGGGRRNLAGKARGPETDDAALPFGGFKESGFGREMGSVGLDHYTEVKPVWVDLS